MTTVTGTTATPAATSLAATSLTSTPTVRKVSQDYSSELFLKLLTTQLANQDPSSPMDSTQMITQTSQLASMEQMTKLTSAATDTYALGQRTAAANVLGKAVTWTDADGAAKTGTVTAASFPSTGSPILTVGDTTIAMSAITGIAGT